jgi:CIC family chloride channel protein
MKNVWQTLRIQLIEFVNERKISESIVIMLTALLVGVGAGLGAVGFRRLINGVQALAFGDVGMYLSGISPLHLMIIPALGGALFGPLIYRFAREAKGHGVPEVMEAVALRGGRIRPRVALVKALASSICIGTGGSVGREGPIAQIGSALGSTIGQALRLSDEWVRTLVACGAAGGIAATFNAPIAGALFALEVILGRFHASYFGAVVISSVIADIVAHAFDGDYQAFIIPEYSLVNPWELIFYAILGLLAALAAVGFTRLLYFSEDTWDKIRVPEYVKPALGGILIGVIGIFTYKLDGYPRVFGVGYESITEALFGQLTLQITLALLFIKMLATITTLGSGGSGGVFAPSLFMGAMLGEAFGQGIHMLFPAITAPAGAYALVGMAAFFSGAAHAPVTAILILFEMTGDYQIILPLMFATVMSTLISRIISRESIYTLKLTRRGIHLEEGQDIDVMQGILVGEAMTTDYDTVPADMTLIDLARAFATTHHHGFPVVDNDGDLVGVVTLQDLEYALEKALPDKQIVQDIATTDNLVVAYPHEPMWVALKRLGGRDIGRLPVVAEEGSRRLLGTVRRSDIIHAYNNAIARKAHHQHRTEVLRLGKLADTDFIHLEIPIDAAATGKQIQELDLPDQCLVLSIRRGRNLIIAHGYTSLQQGDLVTVFAERDCISDVRDQLTSAPPPDLKDTPEDIPDNI